MSLVTHGKFKININQVLGRGLDGTVYSGKNTQTGEEVTAKVEHRSIQDLPERRSSLQRECSAYRLLEGDENSPAVRIILFFGKLTLLDGSPRRVLILNRLGQNLKVLHKQMSGHFTMKTVSMIAIQMLSAFEYLHSKGIVHRDVTPDNIVAGAQNSNDVYLIDFGRSGYLFDRFGRHIPEVNISECIGNLSFCGLNAHLFKILSQRDDLQSLTFTLIYLRRGSLPWQPSMLRDHQTIHMLKKYFSEDNDALRELLNHSRNIGFTTKPNYDLCKKKFDELLAEPGNNDWVMDWNVLSGAIQNEIA